MPFVSKDYGQEGDLEIIMASRGGEARPAIPSYRVVNAVVASPTGEDARGPWERGSTTSVSYYVSGQMTPESQLFPSKEEMSRTRGPQCNWGWNRVPSPSQRGISPLSLGLPSGGDRQAPRTLCSISLGTGERAPIGLTPGSQEIGGRPCADKWSHSTDPSPKANQAS